MRSLRSYDVRIFKKLWTDFKIKNNYPTPTKWWWLGKYTCTSSVCDETAQGFSYLKGLESPIKTCCVSYLQNILFSYKKNDCRYILHLFEAL